MSDSSPDSALPPDTDDLDAQAAAWLAALDTGSADPAAFERWRAADPRRAVAFAKAAALWSDLSRVGRASETPPVIVTPAARPARRHLLQAAGFGAVAILGGGVATRAFARQRLATGVGERLDRRLADGAVLTLNTDTEVLWRARGDGVELWLKRGEVSLSTGGKAFALHAGALTADLTAGGQYNARMRGPVIDVTVLAGQARAAAVAASPAHSLTLTASGALSRTAAEPELAAIAAWRRGEIVFEDAPLSVAVEEYNRYLTRKLVVVDPDLAATRVGGRFTSSDPADFLRALSASLGVTSRRAGEEIILSRAK